MKQAANDDNFLSSEGFGPDPSSPALRRVTQVTKQRHALLIDLLLQLVGLLAAGLVLHTFL